MSWTRLHTFAACNRADAIRFEMNAQPEVTALADQVTPLAAATDGSTVEATRMLLPALGRFGGNCEEGQLSALHPTGRCLRAVHANVGRHVDT